MQKWIRNSAIGVAVTGFLGVGAACAAGAALNEFVQGTWTCSVQFPNEATTATVQVGDGSYSISASDGYFTDAGTWQVQGDEVTITSGEMGDLSVLGVPETQQGEPLSIDIISGGEDEESVNSNVSFTENSVEFSYEENSYNCMKQES